MILPPSLLMLLPVVPLALLLKLLLSLLCSLPRLSRAVVDAGVATGGGLRGLLFLAAPLLLLLWTIREGDEVGLVPLLLLLPGLLLAGVGGALLEPPLVVLLFPAGCWSLSESASSEATDTVLLDFCLILHRVCTQDEDLQRTRNSNKNRQYVWYEVCSSCCCCAVGWLASQALEADESGRQVL
jgi:hypothetical protein